jgi:RNA polymerase sigma-70 factor (ECF subfamily)
MAKAVNFFAGVQVFDWETMVSVNHQDQLTTDRLLDQVQTGDRRALEVLLEQHRDVLRGFVERCLDMRLMRRVDASDVVQETHLEIFQRLDDFLRRRPMPFHLWLWKTAHQRTMAMHRQHLGAERRSVRREVRLLDRSSLMLARQFMAASTASRNASQRELAQRVRQALTHLPLADREILVMRAFDGLSNQEIGVILDLDPASVSKRHGRALVRLHRLLAADGVTGSCHS